MDYDFEVSNSEEEMKNYFKGTSGKHIKDTLFITLRNTGSKGWMRFKGHFKCDEKQSNIFCEPCHIAEDVYPNGTLELVLNFPREARNINTGECYCSIQLVYKDQTYGSKIIRFRKNYDLSGNDLVKEEKVEVEEEEKKEEEPKKEKEKEVFQPYKIEEEIVRKKEEKKEEKKDNENDIIVRKFRSAFGFGPEFTNEYILDLILKSNKDFQRAMMLHLEYEDAKMKEMENKSKTDEGLNELVIKFREAYQLSKEDFPDEKIKAALAKKKGDFSNAFEELMSFII